MVEVTLEIASRSPPDGFPDSVVQTVTENARPVEFDAAGLERSWNGDASEKFGTTV